MPRARGAEPFALFQGIPWVSPIFRRRCENQAAIFNARDAGSICDQRTGVSGGICAVGAEALVDRSVMDAVSHRAIWRPTQR